MNIIVEYEPYAPIADLERKVERLAFENAVLREDQTALCDLLAEKHRQLAVLEQENALLKHRLAQHRPVTGRYRLVGGR